MILRKSGIEVADRNQGVLETHSDRRHGQDVAKLAEYLAALKAKVPDRDHATLLVAETSTTT